MSAGLEAVKRKLRTHAAAAITAGGVEARKQGEIIANLARSFVPKQEGALRQSIRVVDAAHAPKVLHKGFYGVVVLAGDNTTLVTSKSGMKFQNAKLQEGGTQNMPANPFFNPARRMRSSAAKAAINRAMRNAWKGQG